MYKIVLATNNPHKVEEINAIAKNLDVEFILPPEGFNPVEDGDTFEQNAFIKAKEAARLMKLPALADDSGLCVDALDGEPGIFSCRWAETPEKRIEKLLDAMKDVPEDERDAKFVCAMVLLDKNYSTLFSTVGECHGRIAYAPKGTNGFGYDPVFIPERTDLTMAELPEEEKNKISHRAIALNRVIDFISEFII